MLRTGVLDFYQYTPADIAALVRKCQYDQRHSKKTVVDLRWRSEKVIIRSR